jgi:hypothetical protein
VLTSKEYNRVALRSINSDQDLGKAVVLLDKLEVPHRVIDEPIVKEDELLLCTAMHPRILTTMGLDVIVASCDAPPKIETGRDYAGYVSGVESKPNVLFVGFESPTNLALFGAKVVSRQNPTVANNIAAYVREGQKKYAPYEEVIPLTHENVKAVLEAK